MMFFDQFRSPFDRDIAYTSRVYVRPCSLVMEFDPYQEKVPGLRREIWRIHFGLCILTFDQSLKNVEGWPTFLFGLVFKFSLSRRAGQDYGASAWCGSTISSLEIMLVFALPITVVSWTVVQVYIPSLSSSAASVSGLSNFCSDFKSSGLT